MATRMELELTSARPDGSWTWRAAGARQPKGVLDGSILYDGAKVGDIVRAEADVQIDGITILSVTAPRTKAAPERLEIVGPPREAAPGVTTSLVSKGGRRPPGRDRDRARGEGPGGRDGGPRRPRAEGDRPGGRPARDGGREAGDGDRTPGGRRPGADRPAWERSGGPRPGRDGAAREGGRRESGPGRRPGESTGPRRGPRPAGATEAPAERPGARRLSPGTKHRDAVLAELSPEQRPIAEQVLRGGLPAVRQGLAGENEKARAEGRPPVAGESILAIAEDLLPRLKAAEWRDRAEAAAQILDEVSIRDLRSVVAGADAAARDDETRLLASTVRQALERRLEEQRVSWVNDITSNLDDGRVVRALRLSARPPDPGVRFPAEVAVRLVEAAGAALAPDVAPDRWAAVLDAVAGSPVRRNVKPAGLPENPPEELLTAARQAAGRVPALAPLLGLPMPPPPGPARSTGATRPHGPGRPGGPPRAPSARSGPPRRPAAPAPVTETPVTETPVAETPVAETPVAETPVAETPVAETPVAETPVAADVPVAEVPAQEAAPAEAAVDEALPSEPVAPGPSEPATAEETAEPATPEETTPPTG